MSMESPKVVIIGAGAAGLIAAYELEKKGLHPLLFDANNFVGGRLATDIEQGYVLDRGFQVLLTAYREAQRYLDYDALQLGAFRPGAIICNQQSRRLLVDPLREPQHILSAGFSSIGTLKDKYLVWKLRQALKRSTVEELFPDSQQKSSLDFLRDFGFSKAMISSFFKPFFGGIFLESDLATPAPMLQFVFKMFGEGHAALPTQGIKAIPQQLASLLEHTELRLNTRIVTVEDRQLYTAEGEVVTYDAVIVAADPSKLLPRIAGSATKYRTTANYYFSSPEAVLKTKLIALVDESDSMINNFHEVTSVHPDVAPDGQTLISVSLKDIPTTTHPEEVIIEELRRLTQTPNWSLQPLKHYHINEALPALDQLQYNYTAMQSRVTSSIFLAGDHLLMGSLDAAMRSGRLAAEAVAEALRR